MRLPGTRLDLDDALRGLFRVERQILLHQQIHPQEQRRHDLFVIVRDAFEAFEC